MSTTDIDKNFRDKLALFFDEYLPNNRSLTSDIQLCDTEEELIEAFSSNITDMADELSYECSECDDKDDDIVSLKEDKESLTYELSEAEETLKTSIVSDNLNDSYKIEALRDIMNKFSVEEIESILGGI